MVVRAETSGASDPWWVDAKAANRNDPVDGRLARSERTKRKIVDAALRQIDSGDESFTIGAIARRAGISARTLFTHYPDIETLLAEVSDMVSRQFAAMIQPVAAGRSLDRRIDAFVGEQAHMFETMAGFHRAVRRWRERSPIIALRYACYQAAVREKLRQCFEPEFARMPARVRAQHFELLVALTDWEYWQSLRERGGMSIAAAQRALGLALRALLAGMMSGPSSVGSTAAAG